MPRYIVGDTLSVALLKKQHFDNTRIILARRVPQAPNPDNLEHEVSVSTAAALASRNFLQDMFHLTSSLTTSTHFFASIELIEVMRQQEEKGSILICAVVPDKDCDNTVCLKTEAVNTHFYERRLYDLYGNFSSKKAGLKDPPRPCGEPVRIVPCTPVTPRLFTLKTDNVEKMLPVTIADKTFKP